MFNSGTVSFGSNAIFKGCGDDVFLAKLSNSTTGLGENSSENNFLIYPNPSNGIFFIDSKFENAKVEIYNSMGEKVFSSSHMPNSIDISANAKGVYFVKINLEGKIYSRRVIVE